jgi:hypothetical protein
MDTNLNTIEQPINGVQNIHNIDAANYVGDQYILSLTGDTGSLLICDTTGYPLDIQIPFESNEAFPVGTHIDVLMFGSNSVTFDGSKVTLHSYDNKTTIAGENVAVTLIKIRSDVWLLVGNLI